MKLLMSDIDRLIFPPKCLACDELFEVREYIEDFCVSCHQALFQDTHESCPRCSSTVGPYTDLSVGCPKCRDHRFHFQSTYRLGPYDGLLREAILRMKHLDGEMLAEACGRIYAEQKRIRDLPIDAIVPVPLYWQKRILRGYNQAEAIARGLAEGLKKPVRHLVSRSIATTLQANVSATARWQNIKGAFLAKKRCEKMSILLIDDVLTTGATCSEVARVLKGAGAAQVYVAVLAHESPRLNSPT